MEFFAVVTFAFNLIALTSANEFLGASSRDLISEHDIGTSLLSEIEGSLPKPQGSLLSSRPLAHIIDGLRPIYEALPKNEHGKLEHVAARYALHRLFVLRHGWVIRGLEPTGGASNASSPAGILKDKVPSAVEDLFEQRIGVNGFNLQELALLVSTVTHLVQEETVQQLAAAFTIHDEFQTGSLNHMEAEQMLDTYMMGHIVGETLVNVKPDAAQQQVSQMSDLFAHWGESQEFVRGIKQTVLQASSDKDFSTVDQLDFSTLAPVVETIGDQFGEFLHSAVCKGLKARLMDLEYRDTGRVKLSAFYKPALDGFWQFQESASYLRELGALEETDPKEPSVMIANYLAAPANCIASSGFYSVCCKNECEFLLGHLEDKIAAPEATPGSIIALIERLPSDTVEAPRTLSANLLRRLEEIAANHGGMVPLHGRLFAQWMHHAYPRECPYPHISGTTSPKFPEEWLEASGNEFVASDEEMRQYIQWSRNVSLTEVPIEDLMTWSPEEELLVIRSVGASPQLPVKTPTAKRSIALFAVAGLLAYGLVQGMKASSLSSGSHAESLKFAI